MLAALLDSSAAPVGTFQTVELVLSSEGAGAQFHLAADCLDAAVSSVRVASGKSTVRFRTRPTASAAVVITANNDDLRSPVKLALP